MVKVIVLIGFVVLVINGLIIWIFMGWVLDFNKMLLDKLCGVIKVNERVWKVFCWVYIFIIDEISMVESNFFERMDSVLRFVRKRDFEEDWYMGLDFVLLLFGGI